MDLSAVVNLWITFVSDSLFQENLHISSRNHELDTLYKAFELAGYSKKEVSSKFQGITEGLKFGPPPHGGCALGIDRMIMLLAEEENIREVIMFPMNQRGEDLMMNAPSIPSNQELREINLKLIETES